MWFDDEIRMAPDAKLPLMLGEALATPSAMVLANGVVSGLALAIQMALALGYLGWKRHFFDDFHQQFNILCKYLLFGEIHYLLNFLELGLIV